MTGRGFARRVGLLWLGILSLGLAACSTGRIEDPISRSLNWWNFVNGTDIKRNCEPGTGNRYRFVYNAIWGEQVRIYEIAQAGRNGPATLRARVMFPERLSVLTLDDPLAPWRGAEAQVELPASDLALLDRLLAQSGFDGEAPEGLVLPSDGFFWTVAACRDGRYHWNAYAFPSDRFAAIRFDGFLFERDRTGVAVKPPEPGHPAPGSSRFTQGPPGSITDMEKPFELRVGKGGLVGVVDPFGG
jgi:hypothetical protein